MADEPKIIIPIPYNQGWSEGQPYYKRQIEQERLDTYAENLQNEIRQRERFAEKLKDVPEYLKEHYRSINDAARQLLDVSHIPERDRARLQNFIFDLVVAAGHDPSWLDAYAAALQRVNTEAAAPTEQPAPQPLQLPDEIPKAQLYRNRPEGQTLRQFLGLDPSEHPEGWPAPYIRAKVLTQPDVSRLDPSAYGALYNTKEGRELQGLLPKKAQLLDEELSHVDRERIREANRLQRAMERRARAART